MFALSFFIYLHIVSTYLHISSYFKIWVCLKTYYYQCEWVVHTYKSQLEIDVNKRAIRF